MGEPGPPPPEDPEDLTLRKDPPGPFDVTVSVVPTYDSQNRNLTVMQTVTAQSSDSFREFLRPKSLHLSPEFQVKIDILTPLVQVQNQQTVQGGPGNRTQVDQTSVAAGASILTVSGTTDNKPTLTVGTLTIGPQTTKTTSYGPTGPTTTSGTQASLGVGVISIEVPILTLKSPAPAADLRVSLTANYTENFTPIPTHRLVRKCSKVTRQE